MASDIQIANRALQKLGANAITSFSGTTTEAIESNRAYELLRDAELRKNLWSFAKTRESLAAATTAPAFDFAAAYQLPADFLRLIRERDGLDWMIENHLGTPHILTNDGAPLRIRYIMRVTNTAIFDPLFVEALAARMAMEMSEKLSQSTRKYELLAREYDDTVAIARRINAIERPPIFSVDDDWVTVRR